MTTTVARLEARLLSIRALDDEHDDKLLLRTVDALTALRTVGALGALLSRVEDREHDIQEVLLHAVEAFPPAMYCTALARELMPLTTRAPYRTSILVTRVLNSARDARLFAQALVGAGPEIRTCLERVLAEIAKQGDALAPQIKALQHSVATRAVATSSLFGPQRKARRT